MDRTTDHLRRRGEDNALMLAQEADHLFHAWSHVDSTPDDLRELSTVAANLGAKLYKIAGDALDLAEKLDPTPIGFERPVKS